MKNIHIVGGGPEHLIPEVNVQENDVIVGADEGVRYLLKRGVTPNAAFGDFDSITPDELSEILGDPDIDTYTFEREKDMTDLELAVRWAIEQQPDSVSLYGVTGGRLDHELINIQMLTLGVEHGIAMTIIDSNNEIEMKYPGTYVIEKRDDLPYVSFVPFSQRVEGITLEGFRYPLSNAQLSFGSTLCISNELVTKKGTYSFDDGILMMVRSND